MSTDESIRRAAFVESEKLYFDAMKHLTTLSSGSLLLLATFLEKFSRGLVWRALLALTFACFMLAIISSVSAMVQSANFIRHGGKLKTIGMHVREFVHYFALGAYLFGIASLVVFVLKNFDSLREGCKC